MAALAAPPPISHSAGRPLATPSMSRPPAPARTLPVTMQVRAMPTAVDKLATPAYPTPPASLASNTSASTTASVDGPKVVSSCQHFAAAYEQQADLGANLTLATRAAERMCRSDVGPAKRQRITPPDCAMCDHTPTRPAVCLDCGAMLCTTGQHDRRHLAQTGHRFSIDLKSLVTFCAACNDYITVTLPDENDSSPESSMPCAPLRGFSNLGATCFLSAILHSLLAVPQLADYFLRDLHNSQACPINGAVPATAASPCLCCELDSIVSELANGKIARSSFAPHRLLHAIWKKTGSSALAGYSEQDAHELLISLLDGLHASSPGARNVGCACIIHETFAGQLQSDVKCGSCGHISTAVDAMMDLSLDIGGSTSLFACLDRYTASERLAPKQYTCGHCGNASEPAGKQLSLRSLPPVLCIQLKRFEHSHASRKIDTRVRFPSRLDVSPYYAPARANPYDAAPETYELVSVVVHEGSVNTGHYTNFTRRDESWSHFNDETVTPTSLATVLQAQAYILLYVRSADA